MTASESKKELVSSFARLVPITKEMGLQIEEFEKGFVRVRLPKEPNINHANMIFAGSLFALADFTGGVLCGACFGLEQYYPLLKDASIVYQRPALTDVFIEASMKSEEIEEIIKTTDRDGKANFIKEFEIKDTGNNLCCTARGSYQLRKR